MGDSNQAAFFYRNKPGRFKRVLEVGSRNYGSAVNWRVIVEYDEYVGIDMAAGNGLDKVHDLTESPLPGFDLVICQSVLEHCPKPWLLAEGIQASLNIGGVLCLAVPWVWRYHPYPDDYFRFSFSGIKSMFPKIRFRPMEYSTSRAGEFLEAKEGVDWDQKIKQGRKYLPYLQLHCWGVRET